MISSAKIIIISDAPPGKNMGGIAQTLYNLFDGFDRKNLLAISFSTQSLNDKNAYLPIETVLFNLRLLKLPSNRLALLLAKPYQQINRLWHKICIRLQKNKSKFFSGAIVFISTSETDILHFGYHFAKYHKLPLVAYFMDDWPLQFYSSIAGKWITNLVKKTCYDAIGMIYISRQLKENFEKRYLFRTNQSLIIHNPVEPLNDADISLFPRKIENELVIHYCGSIWVMHFDALKSLVDGIDYFNANNKIKVCLKIFSPLSHWEINKNKLQSPAVSYLGYLSYDEMRRTNLTADILLVCSSFLDKFKHISNSSTQTKLTDYMSVGKPILSCGPKESICNQFVLDNKCGYIISDNNIFDMKDLFCEIIQNENLRYEYSKNSLELSQTIFSKTVVQKKLQIFIQDVSCSELC